MLDVCRSALKTFENLGCVIDEAFVDGPLEPVWQAFLTLRHWHAGSGLKGFFTYSSQPAARASEKALGVRAGAYRA